MQNRANLTDDEKMIIDFIENSKDQKKACEIFMRVFLELKRGEKSFDEIEKEYFPMLKELV